MTVHVGNPHERLKVLSDTIDSIVHFVLNCKIVFLNYDKVHMHVVYQLTQ